MDTKHVLGVVGIAVILVAVGFAIGLSVGDDDGKDAGDGGSSGSDKTSLEYQVELRNYPDGYYGLTIKFDAPEAGSFRIYLGDEPLENRIGEPIVYRWSSPIYDAPAWMLEYEPGQNFQYIQDNIRIEFSSNFDAIQV